MIYINSLNEKDKVSVLATLLDEIKAANIFDNLNQEAKIEDLKSTCFIIDNFINQAIEYYKREYLEEERIILLIEHCKRLKEVQKSFEMELISLGSIRDLQNEYELKTAFDFKLTPMNSLKEKALLPNAIEIEKRIKEAINNHDFKTIKPYKNKPWFKIGVLLATGELYEIYQSCQNNFSETARVLVDKIGIKESDRPYISESINNNVGKAKNIYGRLDYMEKIMRHIIEKKLKPKQVFIDRYNKIKQENI